MRVLWSTLCQRRLISSESAAQLTKVEETEKEMPAKEAQPVKHVKMSYRYPGCCVSFLRIILSLWNTLTLLIGLACIM